MGGPAQNINATLSEAIKARRDYMSSVQKSHQINSADPTADTVHVDVTMNQGVVHTSNPRVIIDKSNQTVYCRVVSRVSHQEVMQTVAKDIVDIFDISDIEELQKSISQLGAKSLNQDAQDSFLKAKIFDQLSSYAFSSNQQVSALESLKMDQKSILESMIFGLNRKLEEIARIHKSIESYGGADVAADFENKAKEINEFLGTSAIDIDELGRSIDMFKIRAGNIVLFNSAMGAAKFVIEDGHLSVEYQNVGTQVVLPYVYSASKEQIEAALGQSAIGGCVDAINNILPDAQKHIRQMQEMVMTSFNTAGSGIASDKLVGQGVEEGLFDAKGSMKVLVVNEDGTPVVYGGGGDHKDCLLPYADIDLGQLQPKFDSKPGQQLSIEDVANAVNRQLRKGPDVYFGSPLDEHGESIGGKLGYIINGFDLTLSSDRVIAEGGEHFVDARFEVGNDSVLENPSIQILGYDGGAGIEYFDNAEEALQQGGRITTRDYSRIPVFGGAHGNPYTMNLLVRAKATDPNTGQDVIEDRWVQFQIPQDSGYGAIVTATASPDDSYAKISDGPYQSLGQAIVGYTDEGKKRLEITAGPGKKILLERDGGEITRDGGVAVDAFSSLGLGAIYRKNPVTGDLEICISSAEELPLYSTCSSVEISSDAVRKTTEAAKVTIENGYNGDQIYFAGIADGQNFAVNYTTYDDGVPEVYSFTFQNQANYNPNNPNEILIGADAEETIANIVDAINKNPVINQVIYAAANADSLILTSKLPGAVGNRTNVEYNGVVIINLNGGTSELQGNGLSYKGLTLGLSSTATTKFKQDILAREIGLGSAEASWANLTSAINSMEKLVLDRVIMEETAFEQAKQKLTDVVQMISKDNPTDQDVLILSKEMVTLSNLFASLISMNLDLELKLLMRIAG